MIDINPTQRSSDNPSTNNSAVNLKAELSEEKLSKGTEIASRNNIDIDKPSTVEQQNKKNLIDEVKQNLEKLNDYLPVTSTNLAFEFDELDSPPIIKVYDRESEEVIREIPTEEFREIAKALDEFADKLTSRGLLFNKTA